MIKQEEPPTKPNLKPGIFSRIDTTRPGRPDEKPLTPRKKQLRVSLDVDADKENNQNIVNRPPVHQKVDQKVLKQDPSAKSLGRRLPSSDCPQSKSGISLKAIAEPSQKVLSRDPSALLKVKLEEVELVKEELDKERKAAAELKKRLNSEKTISNSLKNKVKQLEDEKARMEENHRRSLLNIEARVSTLKNTNLLLLSKAQKFETHTKELEEMKEQKNAINDTLSYEFVMSLLRDTFSGQKNKRSNNDKRLKKAIQKKVVTFFQVESETILSLGMQTLFQGILEELLMNQKQADKEGKERNRSPSQSSCSEGSSVVSVPKTKHSIKITPPRHSNQGTRVRRDSASSGEGPIGLPPKARTTSIHSSITKSEKTGDKYNRVNKLEEDYQNYWKPREADANPMKMETMVEEPYQMTTFKSSKDHESIGSTKAETSGLPFGLKTLETHQAFGYSSNQSVGGGPGQKFAVPKLDTTPRELGRNGDVEIQVRPKEEDKGEGQVSKRLKEMMRLSGRHVNLPEHSQKESMPQQPKEYNSLSLGFHQTHPSGAFAFADDLEHRSLPDKKGSVKPEDAFMVAKYDFQGETVKDLSFKKGDVVRLIDKKKNGWWLAEVDNRIGHVPSNFLGTKEEMEKENN